MDKPVVAAADPQGLLDLGAGQLAALVRTGQASSLELVEGYLQRIAEHTELNAFRTVLGEPALEAARRADRRRRDGAPLAALHGVPVAVKDNIDVGGAVTTAGTSLLVDNVASRDARVVELLRAAGAIILGKLHLAEWAIGGTTHNVHFGPARNPWDVARSPGGSSGGSAAAACAGLVPATLGTDTGGSLRIPAALTGTTTIRPTAGLVSTRGVVPVSWTFDTVGPICRRADDVALVLSVIAGYDHADPGSRAPASKNAAGAPADSLAGLSIGVLGGEFRDGTSPGVLEAVDAAIDELARLDATVRAASLPGLGRAASATGRMLLAEAAAVHAERLREDVARFAPDVLHRLRQGAAVTGAEYGVAREEGRAWRRAVEGALDGVDLLVAPACPITAPLIDGSDPVEATRDLMRLTVGLSLAGVPVAVVPCGFVDGLPVAMQLIGADWSEPLLLSVASAFQRSTDWHERRPDATRVAGGRE